MVFQVAGIASPAKGVVMSEANENTVSSATPVASYNVVWKTPGRDAADSMPLGNGDIGLNVWVEDDGDLLLYIGKGDAWSEVR